LVASIRNFHCFFFLESSDFMLKNGLLFGNVQAFSHSFELSQTLDKIRQGKEDSIWVSASPGFCGVSNNLFFLLGSVGRVGFCLGFLRNAEEGLGFEVASTSFGTDTDLAVLDVMETNSYLIFSLGVELVVIGLLALIFISRNLLFALLCLEIVVLGFNFLFLLTNLVVLGFFGFVVIFLLLLLAGAESALGLSIVMLLAKTKISLSFTEISRVR
jgi:NADH:ubiquinone oxidoreductase subunit K